MVEKLLSTLIIFKIHKAMNWLVS